MWDVWLLSLPVKVWSLQLHSGSHGSQIGVFFLRIVKLSTEKLWSKGLNLRTWVHLCSSKNHFTQRHAACGKRLWGDITIKAYTTDSKNCLCSYSAALTLQELSSGATEERWLYSARFRFEIKPCGFNSSPVKHLPRRWYSPRVQELSLLDTTASMCTPHSGADLHTIKPMLMFPHVAPQCISDPSLCSASPELCTR